jgi:hypothetical protein
MLDLWCLQSRKKTLRKVDAPSCRLVAFVVCRMPVRLRGHAKVRTFLGLNEVDLAIKDLLPERLQRFANEGVAETLMRGRNLSSSLKDHRDDFVRQRIESEGLRYSIDNL